MQIRSSVILSAFAAVALFAAGCGRSGHGSAGNGGEGKPAADPNVDVGTPLFSPKPDVKYTLLASNGREPIVIPNCTVQYEERQQVAADLDGRIELIAVRDDDIDPKSPLCVYHPRDASKQVKYRLLKEGATVKAGDALVHLDSQIMQAKMEAAKRKRESAVEVERSAIQGVDLSKQKLQLSKEALDRKTGSLAEYISDQITLTRFEENLANARQTIYQAESDFKEAQVLLEKHRIKSTVNGKVRYVARQAGDFVKAGEKIMEIQATDVVRLEGNLDAQFARSVQPGITVTVEPAVPSAPYKSHGQHVLEVTAIAVTSHPDRPLVISASADGSVRVWDVTREAGTKGLVHPVPVRSIACSPPGAKSIVAVTGCEDGKLRVWDLSNPDKLPETAKELDDTHGAAIGAIAFSPDGRYLATAAGRDVFIWDAIEWKKLYALPAEHRDAITSVSFTPQCTLVTASKDRSLKVWKLGAEQAAVAKSIDHRSGALDVLGVSSDGGRVVFDQDKNRLDLISLADKQTAGQINNVGTTAAFATLALFSRDDQLLVTAGGEGELKGGLQVWNVPTAGGRGSEAARLYTPGRVGVTSAAFSPSAKHPFLVVGTEKGTVHLWQPPEKRKTYTGTVVNIDSTDPRYVTVRVEMDNRELHLRDRSAATVIINPAQ